jgi:regulatory protein
MRITRIEAQRRSTERINVHVDGEFRLALAAEIVLSTGLRIGDEVSADQLAELERQDTEWKAREAALRLLSFRPRSALELRRRLREKGYPDDVAETCVQRLVDAGLVQDAEFAGALVRDRLRFRPQGRRRMLQELRSKGVDETTAREAMQDAIAAEATSELELARTAARKWRPRSGEPRDAARRRLYGLLARRGFEPDAIREVIDEQLPAEDGRG